MTNYLDRVIKMAKGYSEIKKFAKSVRRVPNPGGSLSRDLGINRGLESFFSSLGSGVAESVLRRINPPPKTSLFSKIAPKFVAAAPILGIAVGVDLMLEFLKDHEQQKCFKKMIEQYPELQKLDKVKVLQYFSSLWQLNKDLAKDPTVASSFIKERMEMDMGVPSMVAINLAHSRKSKRDSHDDVSLTGRLGASLLARVQDELITSA